MIMFILIISLIFVMFLNAAKIKKQKSFNHAKQNIKIVKIKSKNNIKSLRIIQQKFFYFKHGNLLKFFNLLSSGVYVFKNKSRKEEILSALTSSGINPFLPIFKCECYDSTLNLGKIYLTFKLAKGLDKMGFEFNLFLFINNPKHFKYLTKLINYFSFKNIKTKIYNCCEIGYKLLSAINFLNLNPETNFNMQSKIEMENYKNNISLYAKIDGVYLTSNQENFRFNMFKYNQYYLTDEKANLKFYSTLSKTYDYKNKATLYKLKIKNLTSTTQTYKCCFGTVFGFEGCKNTFYCVDSKKTKTMVDCDFYVENSSCNYVKKASKCFNANKEKGIILLGEFSCLNTYKNYFYCYKLLKVKPGQETTFYFAVGELNYFYSFDFIANLEQNFESVKNNFNNIKLPKVLSENKTLNYLINTFLPQKIIEQVVFKNKFTADFNLMLNKNFSPALIDKNAILLKNNKNFSSFFLIKDNFFKVYFNLLYFYFGIWQDKNGMYLNFDKSLIIKSGGIFLKQEKNKKYVSIKNLNLKNEVEINKIKYTNLNFLGFDFDKKNNISLCF